jgi:hypothetical protein
MKVKPMLISCQEFYRSLCTLTATSHPQYNISALLDMRDFTVTNELFDRETLEAYSRYNLGKTISPQQKVLMNEAKGGAQGDYHHLMPQKIANVVDCLTRFPHSKRALITIAPDPLASHSNDRDAKCLREVYFRREGKILHASCVFRAQAVSIFPKNIHFIGTLMMEIAKAIPPGLELGGLGYFAVRLVRNREN